MRSAALRPVVLSLILLGACGGTEPGARSGGSEAAAGATGSAAPSPATPSPSAMPSASAADEGKVVSFDADTPTTTPSGSRYIAPKGWSVTTKKGAVTLEDPKHEVSVTFVERKEQDGAAAVATAWKQVNPGFA